MKHNCMWHISPTGLNEARAGRRLFNPFRSQAVYKFVGGGRREGDGERERERVCVCVREREKESARSERNGNMMNFEVVLRQKFQHS